MKSISNEIMHPTCLKDEEKIVKLIRQKENAGIELLYDYYGGALYGVILRLVSNAAVADRVLYATFEKVVTDIKTFRPEICSFFTWVMKISRSLAKDHNFSSKDIDFKDNQNIFDLIVNKGASPETVADLLGISIQECALLLRMEIKKLNSNQS